MMHGRAVQVPQRTREIDQASRKVLRVEPPRPRAVGSASG